MHHFLAVREPLLPEIMDAALAQGFYRMRQAVFTTDTTYTNEGEEVPAVWARIGLNDFTPNNRHRKLTKLCRRFTATLHDLAITPELETLYSEYRGSMTFDANDSVSACLLDERGTNFFPTKMWHLRDAGRLIAAGVFDEGSDSAAGILNFYHPDYSRFSPGLFLYLESVRYAAETGKTFFYPGYIAMGYTKFDYKLLAGPERMEVWDMEASRWLPYAGSAHALQACTPDC